MDSQTGPLWTGRVTWTHDEDSLESIDVTALPLERDEPIVLIARNSSPTVDMVVNVGQLIAATSSTGASTWTCTSAATATDIITCAAHGLKVGDAVTPTASARGLTAGTVYYVVGADHETDVTADTFGVSLTRGGSLVDITGADDTVDILLASVSEFVSHTSFTVPKFAAASSTAPIDGFVSKYISGWGKFGGRIMVEKSAATAGVCTCYLEIRRA